MDVTFLFVDECANKNTNPQLSSSTGILVPAVRYDELRLGFYKALNREVQPETNTIARPPELHFNNLLPESTDQRKIEVLTSLVDLVCKLDIKVARVSYFVTQKLRNAFGGDNDLFGLCYFGLITSLTPLMRKNFVVPIIDAGFSESFQQAVLGYSGSNQRAELMRSVDLNLGLKQDEWVNRMEVLYADSKFSAPIQLADLICGLRSIVDTEKVKPEHKFSEYKKQMLSIGHSLESAMIIDSIASLRFDGEIQGPQEFST